MRGKVIVVSILALLVIAGIWWWKRNQSLPESSSAKVKLTPTIRMANMNITDIDPDKIKVTGKVMLNNPYPVELSTKRLDYEIYVESIRIIKSSYEKPISIKSHDSTAIEMPMEILTKPMKELVKYFERTKKDSAEYTVKTNFDVDVPVAGERTFHVNLSRRLPAFFLPKMEPGKIDVDKLGLHESKLAMVMHVSNPNVFPLKMKDAKYTVVIDSNMKMKGIVEKIVNIPAHGSQDVDIYLDMKTGNMGKLAWKFLFKKKETSFKLDFSCKLLTDNDLLKNSSMAMTAKGTLEELKQLKQGK
jgi:LEA14-like dessication related protein